MVGDKGTNVVRMAEDRTLGNHNAGYDAIDLDQRGAEYGYYRRSRAYSSETEMASDAYSEPPIPPSLLPPRSNGAPFEVYKHYVSKRELITLSIKFPLKNGTHRNDVAPLLRDVLLYLWPQTRTFF